MGPIGDGIVRDLEVGRVCVVAVKVGYVGVTVAIGVTAFGGRVATVPPAMFTSTSRIFDSLVFLWSSN